MSVVSEEVKDHDLLNHSSDDDSFADENSVVNSCEVYSNLELPNNSYLTIKAEKDNESIIQKLQKIDIEYPRQAKSTQILITKSCFQLKNNIMKYEEEIRLNLNSNSEFVYDSELNCFRRNEVPTDSSQTLLKEAELGERKNIKYNTIVNKPTNYLDGIKSTILKSTKERVKFSCTKVIYEFDDEDDEDDKDENDENHIPLKFNCISEEDESKEELYN